jgi:endonuclease-3
LKNLEIDIVLSSTNLKKRVGKSEKVSMTLKERYSGILNWFLEHMQVAETELVYRNPYELIVAVILSAQCTDKRVNLTTPALFERYPSPESMASGNVEDIYQLIKSISYPNNKAKHLHAMAQKLVTDFRGEVPEDLDALQTLPGVGRKTANVIRAVAFEKPAMPVDTHVFRVANRIGLVKQAKTPLETEKQLVKHIPSVLLSKAHHWFILHGRYVCTARKPQCDTCGIRSWCAYYSQSSK